MEALVYRPVFLELGRLTRSGHKRPWLFGQAVFFTDDPSSAEALLALWFWLCPADETPSVRHDGNDIVLSSASAAGKSGLTLTARAAAPGQTLPWRGAGFFFTTLAEFEFTLEGGDSLFCVNSDSQRLSIPLAEGAASYYAELDARECATLGRDSRILPEAARKRVTLILETEGRIKSGAQK